MRPGVEHDVWLESGLAVAPSGRGREEGDGSARRVFKPQLDALIADGTVKRKGEARGSTLHV